MRLLLLIVLTANAFAQQSAPATRDVHLRLMAFENTSIPAESYVFDPAVTQPVPGIAAEIKGYLNHEDMTLKIAGNDLLFSKSMKAEDMKKPEFQLAKVTLPKVGNRFLLIFLPGPDQKFRVLPLDDSIKEFPLGAYRVISLSNFPVKLTLEEKAYEFKPGQSSLITDIPVQENHHSAMYAFSQVDGKWQRIGSGLWPELGNKRSIQIFYDNPESKQTELRGFRDVSPPVPGAAPEPTNAQTP
jgi:hypothetical protein